MPETTTERQAILSSSPGARTLGFIQFGKSVFEGLFQIKTHPNARTPPVPDPNGVNRGILGSCWGYYTATEAFKGIASPLCV